MIRNIDQEAEALARRFKGRNRAAFARETKFPGGQAMIYQNITGRKPISLDGVIAYANGFGCPIADISRHWAQVISSLPVFAMEAPNHYGENIMPIPVPRPDPLLSELISIAGSLSDVGLAILVGRAQEIAIQHPIQAAKNRQK